jgi:hypothetical protein
MLKSDLISHINRYHLSGLVESVTWIVSEDKVKINFLSQSSFTAGEIEFPFMEVGDSMTLPEEIAIYSTSALLKLLSIMDEEIEVSFEKEYGVWMKMNITDGIYESSYSLADTSKIPPVPEVEAPSEFELTLPIDKEFKEHFTKAYKALGSIDRVTVEVGKDVKFTVGNKESYANKISFKKTTDNHLPLRKIAFSGEALFEILKNNPDLSDSVLEIADAGGVGFMQVTIYGGSDRVIYSSVELDEV